ncbi:MAG: hypothetical protein RH916_00300 [Vicingaceae bacterium]
MKTQLKITCLLTFSLFISTTYGQGYWQMYDPSLNLINSDILSRTSDHATIEKTLIVGNYSGWIHGPSALSVDQSTPAGNTSPTARFQRSGISTIPNMAIVLYSSKANLKTYSQGTGMDFYISTQNESNALYIKDNGDIGIGMSSPGYKLDVAGGIRACGEIRVEQNTWCDFVFDRDYRLQPLEEVEMYISKNKHLPDVPSESDILSKGNNLAETDAILLRKIEELTLYIIEQNKRIKELESN